MPLSTQALATKTPWRGWPETWRITKCFQDTALRDIQELLEFGVMVRDGAGGRSTSYSLAKVGSRLGQLTTDAGRE